MAWLLANHTMFVSKWLESVWKFQRQIQIFFFNRAQRRNKTRSKNSTGPHTGIFFFQHNEILPCSLVSTRCDSKWNASEIWNFRRTGPLFWRGRRVGPSFYDCTTKTSFAIMNGTDLMVSSLLDFCTFFFKFSSWIFLNYWNFKVQFAFISW